MKWFTHDCGAMDDIKIVELRVKFGNDGYAVFFQLLELQGREEAPIKLNDVVATKLLMKLDRVANIVREAVRLGLFDIEQWKRGCVYAPNLDARADNYSKRKVRQDIKRPENKPLNEWMAKLEETWHKTRLPKIAHWSSLRRAHLQERLKNPYFVQNAVACIEKMGQSAFCAGENDRHWKATIDFFLANDNNFVKAMEGKYDNREGHVDDRLLKKYGVPGEARR